MKTRPIIGVPGARSQDGYFGVGSNHMTFISHFGNPRIIMPWEPLVNVDLLYLPGGADVNPSTYGETPTYKTSNQDVFKEHFLNKMLKAYIDNNTPIFGVCLGAQSIAVALGLKLTQNLVWHAQSKSRWEVAHKVFPVAVDTVISGLLPKKPIEVNSHHHQAITMANITPDILPLMTAPNEDDYFTNNGDIVEAFIAKDDPMVGVQWHPEELYDSFSINLVNWLLRNWQSTK